MDKWLKNGVFLVILGGIVVVSVLGFVFSNSEPMAQGKAIQSVIIHDQQGKPVTVGSGKVTMGIITPLSGDHAFIGSDVVAGAELAREELEKSALAGKDIDIVYKDSACDAKQARKQATSLFEEGVSYVLSVDCYGNGFPPTEGVVLLSSGKSLRDEYSFSSDVPAELDNLFSRISGSSFSVIFVDDKEGWTYQAELAKRADVVSSYAYSFGQTAFQDIAKKVLERNPERVFIVAARFSDIVPILDALRGEGYFNEVVTNVLITDANLVKLGTGRFVFENVVYSTDVDVQSKRSMVQSFIAKVGEPTTYAANAFDEVMIIGKLIGIEGDSPILVNDRLQTLVNHEGVTGLLTFSEDGVERMYYVKRVMDGKIVDV